MESISIYGARTNNLKDITLSIPKQQLIGIAGVSGSGKSTLISTLAAGSQQVIASFFPPFIQARMKTLKVGEVDKLEGLTFTAMVGQKKFSKNVRSSVSTAVRIAPYLRLLFSRAATPSAGFSPYYSPNDPRGMCKKCSGLGYIDNIDFSELIDINKSLNQGAVKFPTFRPGTYRWKRLVCSGIADPNKPWKNLSTEQTNLLLYGKDVPLENPLLGYPKHAKFDGIIPRLKSSYLEKAGTKMTKEEIKALNRIVRKVICSDCNGYKINHEAMLSKLNGLNIAEASHLNIYKLIKYISEIQNSVVEGPKQNILKISRHLCEIGLGYLTLDRPTDSLSGGESQRLRIVGLLSTPITDSTFILDEPSSGLHPSDIDRLLKSLKKLRDSKNTVIIVEHNLQVLKECDHIIELGPGAGENGGELLFTGSPKELQLEDTPTGNAFRANLTPNKSHFHINADFSLGVKNANLHNLKNISVNFPTKSLTVISGVAGSGKSSLAYALKKENSNVTMIDQLPIMATSRSSLLTALDLQDSIRGMFSKISGLDKSYFSSSGKGGCTECKGRGYIRVDMAFMEDVETLCEKCGGKKFNDIALSYSIKRNGENYTIYDVLNSNIGKIKEIFHEQPDTYDTISLIQNVGLSYLKLGQTLDTLSGGELNRVKLVRFLKNHHKEKDNILVLDEITNGLHHQDVKQLIKFIKKLTFDGFTVIAVDHNSELISQADYNIDMGPGAGDDGGSIIFCGTPSEFLKSESSQTAMWMRYMV